ncbi:MAG: restriction endonuclease subunit S [Gammaproteobacteria bacterium]|nr:restriction endonuclease subunit S [Gammaproteobacteria bacterium]
MTDGLKDAHREAIVAALDANNRVERAVLFGSRATGTNTVTSDVDIALFGDRLTLTDQARLAATVDEIPMAQSVDLILYDSVRDRTLREHIQNDGVEWFTREHAVMGATGGADIRRAALADIIDLTLSSVDKKSKPRERPVRLCNYMDVYNNTFITDQLDFMAATATDHEVARCGLVPGDVIITKDSEKHDDIGVPALVRHDIANLVCGYHLAILRPRPAKVTGAYLVYALKAPPVQHQFHAYANGVTRFGLRKADIGLVEVPLPSLPEQRAIAHVLGTLDDKIELNRRMNETLEAMARALFKSWFVDFDPVRAKMEGRDTGLPDDIADLFPDRMVDSEVGKIPKGWQVVSLDRIARFQNGLALQKFRPAGNEARLPVVKIAQMRAGEANSGEWASAAIKPECIIEDGDVLFSWSGSLLVMMWCGGRSALNQHLFKVTSDRYPKWFYLHSLLSHLPAFRQIARDKATTMGHIRRYHLTEALCVSPPDGVIAELSDTFSCLLDRQLATELSSRTIAALRDTLLPKLISGEIRAAEAETFVGTRA